MIVRRGQPFKLTLNVTQPFDPKLHQLHITAKTGQIPTEKQGTLSLFGVPDVVTRSRSAIAVWKADLHKDSYLQTLVLNLTPPAVTPVGEWILTFEDNMVDICLRMLDLNLKHGKTLLTMSPLAVTPSTSTLWMIVGSWREIGHLHMLGVKTPLTGAEVTPSCGNVMRLLGIPCRVVTNFQSAHDTNSNLTIDEYHSDYGVAKKTSPDSIWFWIQHHRRRATLCQSGSYDKSGSDFPEPDAQRDADQLHSDPLRKWTDETRMADLKPNNCIHVKFSFVPYKSGKRTLLADIDCSTFRDIKASCIVNRANTQITDLKKDIRRLSDELKEKDSLVSSLMEVASVHATIHDTVLWDPSTCPRPSDSSTPGHQQSWSEVVRRSLLNGETSPPRLRLQNRFTTLSDDPVHPADAPVALTRPDDPVHPADAPAALTSPDLHPADTAIPAPAADSICAASQATVKSTRRPSSRLATSSRRKLLKEAVLRHSGTGKEILSQPSCYCLTTTLSCSVTTPSITGTSSSPFRPNHIHNRGFHNQKHPILQCSHTLPPWTTVPVILEKLPGLLHSLPSSVNRLIVHVGSNDTARQQSELTKNDFEKLFNLLRSCEKSVFISGRNIFGKMTHSAPESVFKGVDLHPGNNNLLHHTSEISVDQLIVRRGQPFKLTLNVAQPFDPKLHQLHITAKTGQIPSEKQGTLSLFGVPDVVTRSRSAIAVWKADLHKDSSLQTLVLNLTPPAVTPVGEWILTVKLGGGRCCWGSWWCSTTPDDWVYLKDENEIKEYVMNEQGVIYKGNERRITCGAWDFGQFEDNMVEISLMILDLNLKHEKDPADDVSARCNPIYVSRVVCAMINSQDDRGVLQGNWGNSYIGGHSPTHWSGSYPILRRWYNIGAHPVKYGQCWVFAGVMCSAHDNNANLIIDEYHSDYGVAHKESHDSIWNYHVWVEAWMRRPDLSEDGAFDGWQVVDPTPQEKSDGIFCCGPAPVKAILKGATNLKYDIPFVFSEVNADCIDWLVMADGSKLNIFSDTVRVGHNISTKSVGSTKRLDITDSYKYREGTEKERVVFEYAQSNADDDAEKDEDEIEEDDDETEENVADDAIPTDEVEDDEDEEEEENKLGMRTKLGMRPQMQKHRSAYLHLRL
ncbi:hypothetical protein F7725_017548 [Dissostichus mawsoni]|uniref:Protein-glutamine gamma-glutamyltransferase 2 n=1 Tax=Dissostichus mawsoni TaxID=36200 RepID=A0A7J5Z4R2_DISMA|nr:hypothetical protein F7725_017548 [Dissostichus mawsoni]